jgi:hypothetical protein
MHAFFLLNPLKSLWDGLVHTSFGGKNMRSNLLESFTLGLSLSKLCIFHLLHPNAQLKKSYVLNFYRIAIDVQLQSYVFSYSCIPKRGLSYPRSVVVIPFDSMEYDGDMVGCN